MASSSSSLERNDRLRVSRMTSYEDVQNLFTRTQSSSLPASAVQELDALAFSLENLKNFIDFVSNQAQPPTDNSIFWGFIGLVVQVRRLSARPRALSCAK